MTLPFGWELEHPGKSPTKRASHTAVRSGTLDNALMHGLKSNTQKQPQVMKRQTYLENRFNIRPVGVVSKKLIGDRKMAHAMFWCSFLLACKCVVSRCVSNCTFGQG